MAEPAEDPLKAAREEQDAQVYAALAAMEEAVATLREAMKMPEPVFPVPSNSVEALIMKYPRKCPHCGITKLKREDVSDEKDWHDAVIKVTCHACKKQYFLEYRLHAAGVITPEET